MIKVKGRKVTFTGKEARQFKAEAKNLGLSLQTTLSLMLWEHIGRLARQGVFKHEKGKEMDKPGL